MMLEEFLRTECLAADIEVSEKQAVLRQVAGLASRCPVLSNLSEETILAAMQEREQVGSTGIGQGVAIPHCRIEGAADFVVGVLTSKRGVDFDAIDGKPVHVVVFIISPMDRYRTHIQLLTAISQSLKHPAAVERLARTEETDDLYRQLLGREMDEEVAEPRESQVLLHAFVQDKEKFRNILQILVGLEGRILVAEAQRPSAYLADVPIYAGLWTDIEQGFDRIIAAVLSKGMVNEALRRIQVLAGPLDATKGVLVAVQDLYYVAGNLEF